jgi:DNA polymerase
VSDRRTEVLRELGLLPVWRLRDAAAPEAVVAVQSAATVPPAAEAAPRASAPAPLVAGNERTARIAGMDWRELQEAVAGCTACKLAPTRTKTVFGVGDEKANWLFVGEAPGRDEDLQGEPFVGQAGKLLDSMLAALGMQRGENVYIANMLKCRPPNNRNPEADEVACCEPYLHRQIALIKPKIIVALGKVAAVNLLKQDMTVASMRGKVFEYQGTPLIVTYHPAYLLRTLPDKAKAWADLCFARAKMRELTGGT